MSRRRLFEVLSILVLLLFGSLFLIQMVKSNGAKWSFIQQDGTGHSRSYWIVQNVLQDHNTRFDYYIGCENQTGDPAANFTRHLSANAELSSLKAGFKKKSEKDFRIANGWTEEYGLVKTTASMSNAEISRRFGLAGLAITGRVNTEDNSLLNEGRRLLKEYYKILFLVEPLQVHLEYTDDQGNHIFDREVNFEGIASTRDELFEDCRVTNPYK